MIDSAVKKLISCIVPVCNGEAYLRETLNSVLAQTYRPLELIVVDDGSVDATAAIVAEYGDQARYVWQENAGETSARNRGLSVAQGEFIAFLDADDLWHPEKLARQMTRFEERPEIDLCFTHFQNFWVQELAEEEKLFRDTALSRPFSGYWISTLLARSDAFTRFGRFLDDGSQTPQNMIWFLHASEQGAIIDTVPEILMHRRLHAKNMSRHNKLNHFFPILKAWRDHQSHRARKV
jgi:glycosyltransferase involved in cell wall biosynthesis